MVMGAEAVVRARDVQRTAAITTSVLGVGLIAVALVRAENLVATLAGMAVFLAVWVVVSRFFTKTPRLDLRVVSAAELPPIEPTGRTTAKVVGIHLIAVAVLLGLLFIPWGGSGSVAAVAMVAMVIMYMRSERRIARLERERGGAIWTTSTYAWTSSQAKERVAYLVPSVGPIPSKPDVAGRA